MPGHYWGDEILTIHGFPVDIVPAVNKYNREHRGPDGDAINITQTCIDALRKELKKREHPRQTLTTVCNVGPVEFRRAADLIKNMGYKPEPGLKGRECQCVVVDEGLESPECSVCDEKRTGNVIGMTDRSIWLCPRCMTVITDLEYRHLNQLGCCTDCETTLVQYSRVVWRLD